MGEGGAHVRKEGKGGRGGIQENTKEDRTALVSLINMPLYRNSSHTVTIHVTDKGENSEKEG